MEPAFKFTQSQTSCLHCSTIFKALAGQKFCCTGCEFVFGLINNEGLNEYYQIRDANPPECPLPAQTSSETYEFCDDLEFIEKTSPDGRTMTFYLEALNCTACLWLLEKLPQFCPSAAQARVNMANSTIEVTRVEGGFFSQIAQSLNRFGYRPHPIKDADEVALAKKTESRRDLIRIGIAAAATGNIMILAVSVYGGAEGALANQFLWLASLLATPVMTYCAWPFYKSAWAALRSRTLNLDVPIVAAIIAGILMSFWGLASGAETIYFDSLSMLVFLLLSSRYWLKSLQQRHLDVSHLEDHLLVGSVTRVLESGVSERVSSLSLKKGDLVEIYAEMQIPADGMIESGRGLIQTAILTGETTPQIVSRGQLVEAGCKNLSGRWLMRVEKPASESRLAKILKDTEQSSLSKPSLVIFADIVSKWFIGIVMMIALGLCLYFVKSDPYEGLSRALALIIVTCPCVFGMAIPLSMSLAVRAAARNGMIIKNAEVIERLSGIEVILFDKTGTLTFGEMSVLNLQTFGGRRHHLAAALAIENGQPHPVARAIVAALSEEFDPRDHSATQVRLLPEGGIEGLYQGENYSIRPLGKTSEETLPGQIKMRYGIYCQSALVGQFELGDKIRKESKQLIAWTKANHYKVGILSGDQASIVESCAQELGLKMTEFTSEATPEEKSRRLKELGAYGAMVGDGANDAAALASSGVGIAVRGSMDLSLKAADVYLARTDLMAIPELFEIAKRTRVAVARNLAFSASFNLVAGYLAIAGHMTPMWAAILMPLSSLTVLSSALWTGNKMNHLSTAQPPPGIVASLVSEVRT